MNNLETQNFTLLLNERWVAINSMAAVGIDPDVSKIPSEVWNKVGGPEHVRKGVEYFCQEIMKATSEYSCAYKVQPAFFTSLGTAGEEALKNVLDFAKSNYPEVPIIMDGKFSDISNTLSQYVYKVFDYLHADAVLINPLMGSDSVLPFSSRAEKGVFILSKTSNPSSTEILDVKTERGLPLWRMLINLALDKWNANGNIGLVLSANSPDDLAGIRNVIGNVPVLLAGVGAQGGDFSKTLRQVVDDRGFGVFIPSSRAIMFAEPEPNEHFAAAAARAARNLRDEINRALSK